MKKTTTKWLALICCLVLCTTLTACLSENKNTTSTTQQDNTSVSDSTSNDTTDDITSDTTDDITSDTTEDITDDITSDTTDNVTSEVVPDITDTVTSCQHSQSTWTVTKEATCDKEGTKIKVCDSCAETISTEKISALGHKVTKHNGKQATCTSKGYAAYETCSRCDYTTYKETAALGHDIKQHKAKAATCTAKGNEAYEACSRCSYTTYKETPALGHDVIKHNAKAATCTDKGYDSYETCSRCDHSTYKETAALGHKYVDGICSACGTNDPNYVPALEEIKVPAIDSSSTSIDPIKQSSITIDGAEILTYQGNITKEGQVDTYTYTVLRDGRIRIELSEIYAGNYFNLYVYDRLGERVAGGNYYVGSGDGVTIDDLKAGDTYSIEVHQDKGFSTYTLSIGQQKPTTDISQYTVVKDSIEFTKQINIYNFTVSIDGQYRIEFSDIKSGTYFYMHIYDHLGERIGGGNYYFSNGDGITCNLTPGETYTLKVYQEKNLGSYTLSIGKQKPTTDISQYTVVKDSIEFTKQINVYSFTVPIDGKYRIEFSDIKSGTYFYVHIYDHLGESIGGGNYYFSNGDGITCNLTPGETYTLKVYQEKNFGSYTLSIGKQKPSVDVTSLVKIYDSLQYNYQMNVYNFTADVAGNHTLTINGMDASNAVELYVYNELDEKVKYDTSCKNGDYLVLNNLEIGTKYTIVVCQKSGTCNYTLTIE